MEFERLLKSELLGLCDELGVETSSSMKKSEIINAIRKEDLPEDEIDRMWAKLKAEKEEEATRATLELEKLRLEVELRKTTVGSGHQVAGRHDLYDMTKLIQTYKVEQDMGLYLVNFERACEKARFAQDSWPRRLLSVLPCEAAEVIARLSADDADDYAKVKSSLLKRYRLSAEAFRQKFRSATKRSDASYAEFAYELRCYLIEWMKGADSYESKEKMLETIALEQFYKTLPESMRTWVQDKTGVDSVHKAADLADEHSSRRGGKEGTGKPPEMGDSEERRKNWKRQEFRQKTGESKSSQKGKEGASGKEREDRDKKKAFEAKKPITCFNCHEAGHIAAGCRKPKVVFACASQCEENEELLGPYLYTLTVNGKSCRVLRDSGATIDVVHPDFVTEAHYNGKCSWIRSVIDEGSLCLPVADILISGPFGEVRTEAAVSDKPPPQYP
uniref:Putative tick transposon n=1 Tax=Ixodes ricinus TaxID=34613 RepID=A0A6B0VBN8_IXORI